MLGLLRRASAHSFAMPRLLALSLQCVCQVPGCGTTVCAFGSNSQKFFPFCSAVATANSTLLAVSPSCNAAWCFFQLALQVLTSLLHSLQAEGAALLPLLHSALPDPQAPPTSPPSVALALATGLLSTQGADPVPPLQSWQLQRLLSGSLKLLTPQQEPWHSPSATQVVQLCQALAQWPEGAQLLVEQGALDALLGLVPSLMQGAWVLGLTMHLI